MQKWYGFRFYSFENLTEALGGKKVSGINFYTESILVLGFLFDKTASKIQ